MDGYHEIASLLHAISFGDSIEVSFADRDKLTFEGEEIPIDDSNLIMKALYLFRRERSFSQHIHFHIKKKIPIGSGLGGGSSNAATALWALNELSGKRVKENQLQVLAAQLGSDVPFFFSTGCGLCTGRGEKVQNYVINWSLPIFLALVNTPVDTKRVYSFYQKKQSAISIPTSQLLQDYVKGIFHRVNDLESAAFFLYPSLKGEKEHLQKMFSKTFSMTGSGGSFFCISNQEQDFFSKRTKIVKTSCISRKVGEWYSLNDIFV